MQSIGRFALVSVSLIIFLFCFTGITVALAQIWASGVSKGDVFYYEMYARYSSSNPNVEIKVPEFEANNTDWVRIEISDVNGSIISQTYTLHFKNDSEQNLTGVTDLVNSTWGSNPTTFKGVPICPANLKAGDIIPAVPLSINETLIQTCLDCKREINHLTWNNTEENGACFFDKQTGMLIELIREHAYANPNTGDIIKKTDIIKIISTNAWDTPEFSFLSTLSLLAIIVFFGIILCIRKLSKSPNIGILSLKRSKYILVLNIRKL